MKIHHIGYAVSDIDEALRCFQQMGYCKESPVVIDKDRNVKICFVIQSGCRIELVAPAGHPSPIDNILSKGGGMYHMCYETDNINLALQNLQMKAITPISPAPALQNAKVVFAFHPILNLVEFVETIKK